MQGRLITIVGNSGSGKTTLANHLGQLERFYVFPEEHAERPFQAGFMQDKRLGLANQIDYLLFRADQEIAAREQQAGMTHGIGVQDGGLDLDFHLFTRLFHRRGYLDQNEYALCERLYHTLRRLLPPPDLVVYLKAPLGELSARKADRGRVLDISMVEDLMLMEDLLQEWQDNTDTRGWLYLDSGNHNSEWMAQKILACL